MPKGFYKDPELKFDLDKMQSALKDVDSRVARQSPLGERDINAICLTQIPNDPNSITGGNVRGLYWTKPDSTYEEVQREEVIDENCSIQNLLNCLKIPISKKCMTHLPKSINLVGFGCFGNFLEQH